jgi:cysteine desulfurase / selenocysteine lyase
VTHDRTIPKLASVDVFPGLDSGVYLNTAAEGLFMRSHHGALQRYAEGKQRGSLCRDEHAAVERRARELSAQAMAARAQDVAFLASTARGLDAAIKSIAWRSGDNIVLPDSEFPTTVLAAARLSQLGVERRIAPSRDGRIDLEDLRVQVDRRTRLVVASLVSYKTGHKIDLAAWAEIAHASGAMLFVDAVQALGTVEVDATRADFLCGATYKWLLAQHGLAILYINPSLCHHIAPPYAGYRAVKNLFPADPDRYEFFPDARRFEEGMPNFHALYVLNNALEFLLSIGVDRIAAHNEALAAKLMNGLLAAGIKPLTSTESQSRASIVSFETAEPERIAAELARRGVHVWGRDGRLRISPHLYNDEHDIEAVLAHLVELRGSRSRVNA